MADEQVPPAVQAPPVVAVVVTSDPGPWLEGCLEALRAQDYGALSTLVVDAGSAEPLAERVAAASPEVYIHRLDENRGYGPSANAGAALVEGAAFYLFCHDDVVPDPDAVRRLVEEAFRSNAGIVTPKLVDMQHPDRLLQVGLGMDRFGAPVRRVQPDELDQSQHDEVRDVFVAPGACTLVRSDLFTALGGFDPSISMFGEDVDLCWRARIAGARVVVAPSARVRHVEATASRQRPLPEARSLQWRHELRAVLKNYEGARRVVVVGELLVLSLLEIAYFALVGKRWRARLVFGAWSWNLARRSDLREARAALAAIRRVSDREVREAMDRRGSRLGRSARRLAEGATRHRSAREVEPRRVSRPLRLPSSAALPAQDAVARLRASRGPALAVLVLVAVFAVGGRSLLVGHLPLLGQLLPFPAPAHLLGDYLGGWHDAGLQQTGPASPALGLFGLAGALIGGGTSLLVKVVIVACLLLGGLGAARLLRPVVGVPARLVAAGAYLFLPLAVDDVARGQLLALVVFAATPFVLRRLGEAASSPGAALAPQMAALGLLLALGASFAPVLVPLTVEIALAVALAGLVAGGRAAWAGSVRALAVAAGALVVAVVLTLPWSITYLQPGTSWSLVSGTPHQGGAVPTLGDVVRFELGPLGHGVLGYAFLVAGAGALVLGRGERLASATRFAVVAACAFALAWSGARGWLGQGAGDTRSLLAPAAAGVAACVGLSVATLRGDLSERRLGWRHAAGALFALAGLAGLLPVLGASGPGRLGLPSTGYDTVLSYLGAAPGTSAGAAATGAAGSGVGEVLWLGDPDSLPLVGWQVQPGLAAGVSFGLPDGTRAFPSPGAGLMRAIGHRIVRAESGLTVTLGSSLARDGVRYLVVTTAAAPELPGLQSVPLLPPPPGLIGALQAQQDLRQLPAEGGAVVFANTAWHAGAAPLPAGGTPAALRSLALGASLVATAGVAFYLSRRRAGRRPRHGMRSPVEGGAWQGNPPGAPVAEEAELVLGARSR